MTKKIKYLIFIGLIFIVGAFFYKAYIINKIDIGFNSINVENKRLIQMIEDNDYNIYDFVQIEEGMTMGGPLIKTLEADEMYNKFLELKEQNITHKNYADYIMNVSLIQWFAGNGELAKDIIGLINLDELNKEDKDKYYMIQAGYELTYNRLDKVIEYIELVENPIYIDVTEKIKEFLNVFYKVDLEYKQTDRLKGDNDIIIKIYSNIERCNEVAGYRNKDGNISGDKEVRVNGRVTINGEPVSGALLYLERHKGMSSFEGFKSQIFVTDKNGYYNIDSAQVDSNIGLIMPLQLVSGRQFKKSNNIKFSSEGENVMNYEFYDSARFIKAEIKGDTFYYEIEDPMVNKDREYGIVVKHIDPKYYFGFSFSLATVSYNEMSGEIPVKDLMLNSTFAFPYSSSKDALNINRFIEPLYLTGTYYFSLDCYENDKTYYISNGFLSDQMSTKVYYKGVDSLNEGDKLIADRKVEEAMKWYENNISEHNLKVLIALYSKGYKAVDGEFYQALEGADISKAINYSEIFIESYGESQRILERLRYLYKDIYDFKNERKVLEKMLDKDPSAYTYFELGINSINQGMFDEGLKIIKENIDEYRGHKERYYFPYLILSNKVSNLPVEYSIGLTELEEYKEFHNLIIKGKYIEAWELLQSKSESDVKKMYTLLMIESLDLKEFEFEQYKKQHGIDNDLSFHDYYIDETVKVKDENIKSILKLLKEENNWF